MKNEKRLIDANAFCMYLADVQLANRGWKEDLCEFLEDVMDALGDFPTVEAVELPCKVGDTVYRILDRGYLKDTCETDCYSCEIECPYEGREYERVFEIEEWEIHDIVSIAIVMKNIGQTVFLTREEAGAALAKMDGESK